MFLFYWTMFFTGYEAIMILSTTNKNLLIFHIIAFILQCTYFLNTDKMKELLNVT